MQIVKIHDGEEETNVLMALACMGEVISEKCQLKLNGRQEVASIAETSVLEIQETSKIRDLYRGFSKFRKT